MQHRIGLLTKWNIKLASDLYRKFDLMDETENGNMYFKTQQNYECHLAPEINCITSDCDCALLFLQSSPRCVVSETTELSRTIRSFSSFVLSAISDHRIVPATKIVKIMNFLRQFHPLTLLLPSVLQT